MPTQLLSRVLPAWAYVTTMENDKSEFGLIHWIRQQNMSNMQGVCVGIGDDMAVMEIGGEKILVTCDMLLEGVHFELNIATLEQVGYKAMACSLSDCAAMAAVPWCAVVSVALPNTLTMTDAQQIHKGLQQAAQKYACPIVGGDTTSWDKSLVINVTMLAKANGIEPVLRSGAKVDDSIFVTGQLGGSLAGRHLEFTPRVAEARTLAEMADLHALIDISDGLAQDLNHICTESSVAAIINQPDIPISNAARQTADPLQAALNDGEDFELLFCVNAQDAQKLLAQWPQKSNVKLTCIGQIITLKGEAKIVLRDAEGNTHPVNPKGWEHFT